MSLERSEKAEGAEDEKQVLLNRLEGLMQRVRAVLSDPKKMRRGNYPIFPRLKFPIGKLAKLLGYRDIWDWIKSAQVVPNELKKYPDSSYHRQAPVFLLPEIPFPVSEALLVENILGFHKLKEHLPPYNPDAHVGNRLEPTTPDDPIQRERERIREGRERILAITSVEAHAELVAQRDLALYEETERYRRRRERVQSLVEGTPIEIDEGG